MAESVPVPSDLAKDQVANTLLPTGHARLPSRYLPTSYRRLGGDAVGTSACAGLWESITFWARLGPSSLKGLAFGWLANELMLQDVHSNEYFSNATIAVEIIFHVVSSVIYKCVNLHEKIFQAGVGTSASDH